MSTKLKLSWLQLADNSISDHASTLRTLCVCVFFQCIFRMWLYPAPTHPIALSVNGKYMYLYSYSKVFIQTTPNTTGRNIYSVVSFAFSGTLDGVGFKTFNLESSVALIPKLGGVRDVASVSYLMHGSAVFSPTSRMLDVLRGPRFQIIQTRFSIHKHS